MGKIRIPVCEPSIGETELQYVTDCVRSGWISSKGEYVTKFEGAFSKYCGAKFGVSASSGTAALHLALLAIGINPGDEVIIPAFTMIATANVVTYTGARPVLVDSEPLTWNMDVQGIEEKISGKTKAVMVVYTYGHPLDIDPVLEVAQKQGLYVVEDACEAHGAEYKGKRAGALGDISCFSFYANKIITTGEGGMLVTNNEEFAEKARLLRDQAFEKTKRFWHKRIGYNYRMTNLQAAVGLAQMERIDEFVKIRRSNAAYYNSLLEGVEGITLPPEAEWAKNVYWMYSVLIEDVFGVGRDELMEYLLSEHGVDTRNFFYPIHTQPAYAHLYEGERYRVAEELSRKGVNLPSGNTLTKKQIEYVVNSILSVRKKHG